MSTLSKGLLVAVGCRDLGSLGGLPTHLQGHNRAQEFSDLGIPSLQAPIAIYARCRDASPHFFRLHFVILCRPGLLNTGRKLACYNVGLCWKDRTLDLNPDSGRHLHVCLCQFCCSV